MTRSYYAAYFAATSRIIGSINQSAHGRRNPSHEQLPDLIANTGSIAVSARKQINKSLRFLRQAREDADYRPHSLISRSIALDSIHNAISVQSVLGIGEKNDD